MRLPVPPSVWVTVQGELKNYHWLIKLLEGSRPALLRGHYPSGDTPAWTARMLVQHRTDQLRGRALTRRHLPPLMLRASQG
eukprot:44460-Heterocapsa_arctica.AAC.1